MSDFDALLLAILALAAAVVALTACGYVSLTVRRPTRKPEAKP